MAEVLVTPVARRVPGLPEITQAEVGRLFAVEVRFLQLLGLVAVFDRKLLVADKERFGHRLTLHGGMPVYDWNVAAEFMTAVTGIPAARVAAFLYLHEATMSEAGIADERLAEDALLWARRYVGDHPPPALP